MTALPTSVQMEIEREPDNAMRSHLRRIALLAMAAQAETDAKICEQVWKDAYGMQSASAIRANAVVLAQTKYGEKEPMHGKDAYQLSDGAISGSAPQERCKGERRVQPFIPRGGAYGKRTQMDDRRKSPEAGRLAERMREELERNNAAFSIYCINNAERIIRALGGKP